MVAKKTSSHNEIGRAFRKAGPYLNIGYTLFGGIALFGFLGYWLDKKLQLSPLFLLLGIFLGLILGFYYMIKVISNIDRK